MSLVKSVSEKINYGMEKVEFSVHKIVKNPSKTKKLLQLINYIILGVDYTTTGSIRDRKICHVLKGSVDIIGFYAGYKSIMYWVHLFSKDTLDKEGLKASIEDSLCASHKGAANQQRQKKLAYQVFQRVIKEESYHSEREVRNVIIKSLKELDPGYSDKQVRTLADRIIIKQEARSAAEMFYMACFAVSDVSSMVLNLQKWDLVNVAKLASQIGSQSKVFAFVVNIGVKTILGPVALAGMIVLVGQDAHETIKLGIKYYYAENGDVKAKAAKELYKASISLLNDSIDLATMSVGMVLVLNPPAVIALGIISKGTGLICFLIK